MRLLFSLLFCLIIFGSGLQTTFLPNGTLFHIPIDKIAHSGLYCVLSYSAYTLFKHHIPWAALALFNAGTTVELIQLFTPGRSFEFSDIAANTFGLLIGYGLYCLHKKLFSQDTPQ